MANDLVPNADFSWLGNIGKIYEQARDKDALSALGEGLAAGTLDYKQAAGKAAKAGNLDLSMSLLKLGREQEASERFNKLVAPMLGGGAAAPQAGVKAEAGPVSNFGNAISSIESGGKYDALGPVTRTGDRAHGKYQVMGANIGPWTQEVFGKPMSTQEFLASPKAQDAVFNAKFGQYAQKYGPEGAARAWFAGEGGMNDPNRKDQLGTTVAAYGQKFSNALGGQPAMALASNRPPSLPPQIIGEGGAPARPDAENVYPPDAVMQPQAQPAQVAQAQPAQPPAQPGNVFTAPSITSSPAGKQQIPILAAAMSNIGLSQPQREMAKTLLEHHLKSSDYTEDEKKYWRTYVPQEFAAGQQPKRFNDWMIEQKRASAITSGESTFETELSKIDAKRFGKFLDNGEAAQRKMVDINQMREISNRVGSQGAWAGIKEVIGPYAEALGIDVKNLSDIQTFTSVVQRLAPQNRVEGSGSTSDIEFKGMLKSMPGLANNPAARTVVIDTMEALARREMAEGDIAARLAAKEITRGQAQQELRKLPDPMTAFRDWRKANPEAFRQGLSTSAQAQKPEATQQVVPEAVRSKPVQEQMNAAPDGTIVNFGGNNRRIKQDGKWVPYNG